MAIKPSLVGQKFTRLLVIEKTDKRQHGKIVYKCLCDCGNIIEVASIYLRSGNTKSCGCLQKDKASDHMKKVNKATIGENHPRWRGGITAKRSKDMATEQYKNWRESVFQRDCYICQACGQYGGRLVAHHIWAYSRYPDKRYDTNNGATLCRSCHYEYHKKYGKTNFLPQSFDEFIADKARELHDNRRS